MCSCKRTDTVWESWRFGSDSNFAAIPSLRVSRVATLHNAGPGSLSFFANARYRKALAATGATAVLIAASDLDRCPVAALVDANPYLAYARIATALYPSPSAAPGIDPSATVSPHAHIDPSATIGPLCIIEAGAHARATRFVGAASHRPRRYADRRGHPFGVACDAVRGTRVGQRCIFHPGVVIGADGFGFAMDAGQLGQGAAGRCACASATMSRSAPNTTIDRGAIEDTVVENGVKLDNQIQIGHNVSIGEHTAIASCTGHLRAAHRSASAA